MNPGPWVLLAGGALKSLTFSGVSAKFPKGG
jgi:hypothetical protein